MNQQPHHQHRLVIPDAVIRGLVIAGYVLTAVLAGQLLTEIICK